MKENVDYELIPCIVDDRWNVRILTGDFVETTALDVSTIMVPVGAPFKVNSDIFLVIYYNSGKLQHRQLLVLLYIVYGICYNNQMRLFRNN